MASPAAQVAQHKERHPELYCPERRCLWHTGGGRCPRHPAPVPVHPDHSEDRLTQGYRAAGLGPEEARAAARADLG